MKKQYLIIFLALFSCTDHSINNRKLNNKAEAYNEKGTRLFAKNSIDSDSINLALLYIDSAILLDLNNTAYKENKIEIYKSLTRFSECIPIAREIINIDGENFSNLFLMGSLFEKINLDSSRKYLNTAYMRLQNGKEKMEDIYIGYFKLKILQKLNDSLNFSNQLQIFEKTYKNHQLYKQLYTAIIDTTSD